ncbi:MAG: TIR domain-containing protein [Hyphomonadaceae bacterium]|nr:TIR domain-containing protein [Hyphomonadaceae bacterium]
MASVVIIHAAEDTLPARALAEKLRQAQVQVILERPPGEELRNAVKSSQVTIALWSPRSNGNAELAEEVKFARGKSNVFHALMQSAQAPDAFRGDKSVNLTGWRGEDEFAPWRELANLVTAKAGVAPLPPPAPKPPSGFFQPGRAPETGAPQQQQRAQQGQRPAPQPQRQQAQQQQRSAPPPRAAAPPRAPDAGPKKGGGMVVIAAIVFVVVAALGGGGYWFMTQNSATATSNAWDSVSRDDADALRDFLAGDPGEHRAEAQQALASLEQRSFDNANSANTIEAFEAFLNDFPESEHATRARGRIAELRLAQPATEPPTEEVPLGPETDPDLLPPGVPATTTPEPDTSAGPQQITPPDETNQPPADLPTN